MDAPLCKDIMHAILDLAQQYKPHLGYKIVREPLPAFIAFVSEDFYTWLSEQELSFSAEYQGRSVFISVMAGEKTSLRERLDLVGESLEVNHVIVVGRELVGAQYNLFPLLRENKVSALETKYAFVLRRALEEAGRSFRLSNNGWDYVCALQ